MTTASRSTKAVLASFYAFEVLALALATGVDARWLLGLTDAPEPLTLLPLPEPTGKTPDDPDS